MGVNMLREIRQQSKVCPGHKDLSFTPMTEKLKCVYFLHLAVYLPTHFFCILFIGQSLFIWNREPSSQPTRPTLSLTSLWHKISLSLLNTTADHKSGFHHVQFPTQEMIQSIPYHLLAVVLCFWTSFLSGLGQTITVYCIGPLTIYTEWDIQQSEIVILWVNYSWFIDL